MRTPLRWVTGGGDQEKLTCLCPASVTNISGEPLGAGNNYYVRTETQYEHHICTNGNGSKCHRSRQ